MASTSEKRRRRFGGWLVVALVALPAIALAAYIVSANLYVDYQIGEPPTITVDSVDTFGLYLDNDGVTTSALPGGTTCAFDSVGSDAAMDIVFWGFFPNEACLADITISSEEPLTNLRVDGGSQEVQIYLTDGSPDYWPTDPQSTYSLTGTGPYTWTGKVVVMANWDALGGNPSGTYADQFSISGDFTR